MTSPGFIHVELVVIESHDFFVAFFNSRIIANKLINKKYPYSNVTFQPLSSLKVLSDEAFKTNDILLENTLFLEHVSIHITEDNIKNFFKKWGILLSYMKKL